MAVPEPCKRAFLYTNLVSVLKKCTKNHLRVMTPRNIGLNGTPSGCVCLTKKRMCAIFGAIRRQKMMQ